ncbi:MAG TPA: YlbF family regulator [Clostridia bacterium]|nr:YlbF family regulator [Clostridia bacterium]
MEVYDEAYALAKALSQCQAVKDYENAKSKLDEKAKQILIDYRKRQIALQKKQLSGEKPDELEVKRLQHLASLVAMHPSLHKIVEAEARISMIIADVQKIIAGAVQNLFLDEIGEIDWTSIYNQVRRS